MKRIIKKILRADYGSYVRTYLGKPHKPDFIIIGAQKAGTTTLQSFLQNDKRLFSPRGEVAFFGTNNYFNGIQ